MTRDQLEFVIFTINSVAERLGKPITEVYNKFKNASIITDYLIPAYDILHTLSREYIVNDLLDFAKTRNVAL